VRTAAPPVVIGRSVRPDEPSAETAHQSSAYHAHRRRGKYAYRYSQSRCPAGQSFTGNFTGADTLSARPPL